MKSQAENEIHTGENLSPVEAAEPKAGGEPTERALEERLRFEQLLSGLSARFVHIAPDRVDSEIEASLKQIRDFFTVDRVALLRYLPDKASWQITHVAVTENVPPIPTGVTLPVSINPWAYDTLIQPIVNYNLKDGWYLTSVPLITANWMADSGNQWTVPLGGGFGKLWRVGKVGIPVNTQLQAFYNVERPHGAADWSLRFHLQFVLPK